MELLRYEPYQKAFAWVHLFNDRTEVRFQRTTFAICYPYTPSLGRHNWWSLFSTNPSATINWWLRPAVLEEELSAHALH